MNNANTQPDQNTTEDTREIHPAVITWALVIGLVVAFVVTASSFKLSFTTLLDLGIMAGMRDSAWVIPVVLDGPILAASIFRIALSQHTDRATVRGRRFIIAVFALAGVASMAGNAYHAVLTVTDLNAAVAAAMGALAPLMVMTMGEMISVAISAPRRRITANHGPVPSDVSSHAETTDEPDSNTTEPADKTGETIVDEDPVENGRLKPAVWTTVELYLSQSNWTNTDIARHLKVNKSTVSRHLQAWATLQLDIARTRKTPENDSAIIPNSVDDIAGDSTGYSVETANEHLDTDRELVEASR